MSSQAKDQNLLENLADRAYQLRYGRKSDGSIPALKEQLFSYLNETLREKLNYCSFILINILPSSNTAAAYLTDLQDGNSATGVAIDLSRKSTTAYYDQIRQRLNLRYTVLCSTSDYLGAQLSAELEQAGFRKLFVVPLHTEENMTGALFFLYKSEDRLPQLEQAFWDRLSVQVSQSQELIRLSEQIPDAPAFVAGASKSLKIAKLLELSQEIARVRDRENLLLALHGKIKEVIPFNDMTITIYDHTTKTHAAFLYYSEEKRTSHPDFEKARDSHSPIGDGVVNRTMKSLDPVIFRIDDLLSNPVVPLYVEFYKKSGITEFVGVSMHNSEGIFGGLYLFAEQENTYHSDQFELIRGVANQLSNTIYNILISEEIKKKEQEKSILLNLGNDLSALRRTSEFASVLLERLNHVFSFDHASISLNKQGGKQSAGFSYDLSSVCQHYEIHQAFKERGYLPWDDLNTQAVTADFPLAFKLEDLLAQQLAADYVKVNYDCGMRQVVFVPLRSAETSIGFLVLMSEQTAGFTTAALELIQGVSYQLSNALSNLIAKEAINLRDIEKANLLAISNDLAAVRNMADLDQVMNGSIKAIFPHWHIMMLKISRDEKWIKIFLADHGFLLQPGDHKQDERYKFDNRFLNIDSIAEKPVLFELSDPAVDNVLLRSIKSILRSPMQQVLIVGVNNGKRKTGLLLIFTDKAHPFHPEDIDLIQGLSAQIATAMVNVLANERIARQIEEISAFRKQLEVENLYLQEEIFISHNNSEIVGTSSPLRKMFGLVASVASSSSTVLLLGETGTGKELFARAIHNSSSRKDKLMVKVNCAALPANLIESELFGHEKGSFTGATDRRIGKFELANNGTLFLDEIGELPWDLQVKLLRALQEKEIERIGGRSVIKIDIRVIVATNRNLEREVQLGNFRNDLFFRLNVFPIEIPPLRDRKEDIPMLAAHFLTKHAKKAGKKITGFSGQVIRDLISYDWPGNVRELEHLIERSILLAKLSVIDRISLPGKAGEHQEEQVVFNGYLKTIEEVERDHILKVLKACSWKVAGVGGAAELLNIPSTTLSSKIKKLGIKRDV